MPPAPRPAPRAREGTRGTTLSPARPAHTPNASSSAKPLPGLTSPYGQSLIHRPRPPHTQGERSPEPLDTKRHLIGYCGLAWAASRLPTVWTWPQGEGRRGRPSRGLTRAGCAQAGQGFELRMLRKLLKRKEGPRVVVLLANWG